MQLISAVLVGNKVVVPALNEGESLYQDGYGSREKWQLSLTPVEALYLSERNKLTIMDERSNLVLPLQELISIFMGIDPEIWTKFIIYRDLRSRGFVAKPLNSEGIIFSVYERGVYPVNPPRYMVYSVYEGSPVTVRTLQSAVSKANVLGMSLKVAVIDRRGELIYYSLDAIDLDKF